MKETDIIGQKWKFFNRNYDRNYFYLNTAKRKLRLLTINYLLWDNGQLDNKAWSKQGVIIPDMLKYY